MKKIIILASLFLLLGGGCKQEDINYQPIFDTQENLLERITKLEYIVDLEKDKVIEIKAELIKISSTTKDLSDEVF